MIPDDDIIHAWLDGTLDKDGAQRMTDLAANDDTFARRVLRMQHLDELVRTAVPAGTRDPSRRFSIGSALRIRPRRARFSVWLRRDRIVRPGRLCRPRHRRLAAIRSGR